MTSLKADLRLAWELTRGSDRGEWWRVTLTATGAALATGFTLAAVALASLRGQYNVPVAAGLLNQPGTRSGVIVSLMLLLVPVLGFLGQCARIGAVHRDRRLAGLRLAGATAWQVRRIAALETGLACLLGSAVATVLSVLLLLRLWGRPTVLAWAGMALVAVAVPLLGAAAGALALRRVVASPLGWVRRLGPRSGRGPGLLFLAGVMLVGVVTLVAVLGASSAAPNRPYAGPPLMMVGVVLTVGAGAVWLSGAAAKVTGRVLATRARSAAALIAAERLRDDPWAAARTHAAVLLVTVIGGGFMGVRAVLLAEVRSSKQLSENPDYYITGLDLTGVALAVALAITLSGLAVGTAESLATRRRGLAAQVAAGVPRAVLGRALLLETALPLAPAVLLAGLGGTAVAAWYALLTGHPFPWAAALVPVAVYAGCLLAAATSLPLLGRSVRPAELRYA
ncbi:FtsX-like permease family protein [Streptomyces sp. NRRL B-1140]|uniref:FtsX-like permease family protein n=1 Tax=Streptomyces sp. NRRL B-1140 TaxID=1415549 RepID=UPI0006AF6DAD|nr:FtsX-like permease family protein [Streptomyces sp. NRRL B-1140]